MSIVRVALAQVAWAGDRESTMDQLELAGRDAAGRGAGLVAFPELCTTPYFCTEPGNTGTFEPIPDGPTTRRMSALAKELSVVLVVPLAERDTRGARYNSAAVFDADGTVAGAYRKRHLPHGPGCWERAYFRPGASGPAVFSTAAGRVGVAICWDRYFPDTWDALGRQRAQITVVPVASIVDPGDPRATLVQPTVAFLHRMFVATINRVDAHYTGGSYVAGPSGDILGPFGPGTAELLIREIDLDRTEASRETLLAQHDLGVPS